MIRSGAIPGVAFGHLADGDARTDTRARAHMAAELGIPTEWATVSQVHGAVVRVVDAPGHAGDADGLITQTHGVPLVIATADCVPIAIAGERTIAVVHAGWRGIAREIVPNALDRFRDLGDPATVAVVGPHIGSCCYEVGEEVVAAVGHPGDTTWGTTSVDLRAAVHTQLGSLQIEDIDECTMDEDAFASYRRDGTPERQVTVAWLS